MILDGPRSIDGVSWYRVEWRTNSMTDTVPGWMPSTFKGHPAVAPVAPRCATVISDVIDLAQLHPAERLRCFGGRAITLGPVILRDDPGRTPGAAGSPAWLADEPTIGMFGRQGVDGVDPPMLVRADPEVIAGLSTNIWLEVTGHFDDPAAADCQRSWIEDNGWGASPVPQTPAEQVASCKEQLVITATRPVPTP